MMPNGFDPASDARFRATVEIETKHIHKQIELLWQHNHKRRAEIIAAHKHLTGEIDAIKRLIWGALASYAAAASALAYMMLKTKLGL